MSVSKIVAAAASGVGSAGLDVDEVFNTQLWNGTNASQTITNGIDLTEGGLIWTKARTSDPTEQDHQLLDTEQGAFRYVLESNTANARFDFGASMITPNTNGFTLTSSSRINQNTYPYVGWTFRKAKKFFDIVTYSGNGSSRTIAHNLGSSPGMVIVKRTDSTGDWWVWHRSATQYNPNNLQLNSGNASVSGSGQIEAVSSTTVTLGTGNDVNNSSGTYVAYLFAHNDSGDGEFGPDSDQDIIKCGSYTGNGSSQVINLGFEAQFVFYKAVADLPSYGGENWNILDTMRGMPTGGEAAQYLIANTNAAETGFNSSYGARAHASGFEIFGGSFGSNYNGNDYIYMAIRRGPLAVPEDATKVFNVATYSSNGNSNIFNTGFDVDMNITTRTGGTNNYNLARLTGSKYLWTDGTNAEADVGDTPLWDGASNSLDLSTSFWGTTSDTVSWSFKRASGYFDVVCYTGTGSNRTVSHNLGAVPEMMWIKARTLTYDWLVPHKDIGAGQFLSLNSTAGLSGGYFNNTRPTSSVFTLGSDFETNRSGYTFIAYLFATVAGVSKVGSVTHSGSSTDVDCGFASGARLVILKRTDASGDWYIWDSVRGIVSGNDPYLLLNSTAAQVTNTDYIDPLSSGFQITGDFTDGTYIFYAIA